MFSQNRQAGAPRAFRRFFIRVFALSVAVLSLGLGRAAADQPVGKFLKVFIATDQATYHVGQPIKVQVTLQNISATDVVVRSYGPWYLVDLTITDQNGVALASPGRMGFKYLGGTFDIDAGQSRLLSWQNDTWTSLSWWGYDVHLPGTYTIVAYARAAGRYPTTDTHFTGDQSQPTGALLPDPNPAPSNSVLIQVVP